VPLTVQLVRVSVPPLLIPPPAPLAVFPLTVQSVSVSLPVGELTLPLLRLALPFAPRDCLGPRSDTLLCDVFPEVSHAA
jgi:hypothetical protein